MIKKIQVRILNFQWICLENFNNFFSLFYTLGFNKKCAIIEKNCRVHSWNLIHQNVRLESSSSQINHLADVLISLKTFNAIYIYKFYFLYLILPFIVKVKTNFLIFFSLSPSSLNMLCHFLELLMENKLEWQLL